MSTATDNRTKFQVRQYDRTKSVVFLKTNEDFGALSNMAGGFPLKVNGVSIRTSEALYQACRFPHRWEIQREIIAQHSPMAAKMKSKPHRHDSRKDWDLVRIEVMRWCLRVKLVQNWDSFRRILLDTEDRPIVERSRRDFFWGARLIQDTKLVGVNALGELLTELRNQIKERPPESFSHVEPVGIKDFLLYGRPIENVFQSTDHIGSWLPGISDDSPMDFETSTPATLEAHVPACCSSDIVDRKRIEVNAVSSANLQIELDNTPTHAMGVDAYPPQEGQFPLVANVGSVPTVRTKNQNVSDTRTIRHSFSNDLQPLPFEI